MTLLRFRFQFYLINTSDETSRSYIKLIAIKKIKVLVSRKYFVNRAIFVQKNDSFRRDDPGDREEFREML